MPTVLIVDDSATVRHDVRTFLQQHGLSVMEAEDGRQGLQQLRQHTDIKLVICDVNMPVMDGLTMTEKVRQDLCLATPIIMLTTENCPNMKARGKAAGVKGWIVKPFNGPGAISAILKLAAS
jgi:two-component system chemotaxis response regulator CheY